MLSVGERGGVTYDASKQGMSREQAVETAERMVSNLHSAGRRAVREAKENKARQERKARKEKEEVPVFAQHLCRL